MTADASRLAIEWFKRLTASLAELPPEDEFSFLAHQMALAYVRKSAPAGARAAFIAAFEATARRLYQAAASEKEP